MKKCPDCSREVDRMAVICEFCGRVEQEKLAKIQRLAKIEKKAASPAAKRKS